jgi:hypothetical protein
MPTPFCGTCRLATQPHRLQTATFSTTRRRLECLPKRSKSPDDVVEILLETIPPRRMHRRSPLRVALLAFAALLVASCGSTEPRHVSGPLVGTWDITTALDTFTFETPAPSPPDCPAFTLYCTHLRADTLGRLAVTLTIGDSVVTTTGAGVYNEVSSVVWGSFCDSLPNLGTCAHARPIGPVVYPIGQVTGPRSVIAAGDRVQGELWGPTVGQREIVSLSGRFDGDSIIGTVYWAMYVSRSPPSHRGTFVARRRK